MRFSAYTMEYRGDPVSESLRPRHYKAEDHREYKRIYEDCRGNAAKAVMSCLKTVKTYLFLKKTALLSVLLQYSTMRSTIFL